jgi:hypothetical protein
MFYWDRAQNTGEPRRINWIYLKTGQPTTTSLSLNTLAILRGKDQPTKTQGPARRTWSRECHVQSAARRINQSTGQALDTNRLSGTSLHEEQFPLSYVSLVAIRKEGEQLDEPAFDHD